jgi:hypothetical protein
MPPRRWYIDDYSTFSHIFDEDLLREMASKPIAECLKRTLKDIQRNPLDAQYVTVGKVRFYVVRAGGYGHKQFAVPELLIVYIADANVTGADAEALRINAMIDRAAGKPVHEGDVGVIHPVCVCKTVSGLSAAARDQEVQQLVERRLRRLDRWKAH